MDDERLATTALRGGDDSECPEKLHKIMAGTNQLPFASNCVNTSAQKSIDAQGTLNLPKDRLDGLAPQLVFRFAPFGAKSSSHTLTGTCIGRDSPLGMLLIEALLALL